MAFNVYDIPDMCTTLTFSSSDDWRTLYSGTACISNLKKVVTPKYYEYMHFIFRQYVPLFWWIHVLTNLLLRLWLWGPITILLDSVSHHHLYLPHQKLLVTLSFAFLHDLFCSLTQKVHHSSWKCILLCTALQWILFLTKEEKTTRQPPPDALSLSLEAGRIDGPAVFWP